MLKIRFPLLLLLGAAILPGQAAAGTPPDTSVEERRWSVHFQATAIGQAHGSFTAPYEGENSLPGHAEHRVSLTTTLFLTGHLSRHWEVVVNPEVAGGRGFGDVTGIAGFTNGEIPRVASATPTPYVARAYVRAVFPLGSSQLDATSATSDRKSLSPMLSVVAGKFAITDFFDNNSYSHDPRTQFINWALMYNGAWDYPADVRGYTIGTMQELRTRKWALRSAVVMEPTTANGATLDMRVLQNRGVAFEYEYCTSVLNQPAAIRVLAFNNQERAGTYREAVRDAAGVLVLDPSRRNSTHKYGFGVNAEQALGQDAGLFGRYGWNDGKTESWAFTEIDRSVSGGVTIKGRSWRRSSDVVGFGAVRNYLSGDHRAFLAGGGYGFIIGDGKLNYAPETVIEAYYSSRVSASWTITGDYQRVTNPAYNRDRGPVGVASLRLHWER